MKYENLPKIVIAAVLQHMVGPLESKSVKIWGRRG
jgi:hypothetical protein